MRALPLAITKQRLARKPWQRCLRCGGNLFEDREDPEYYCLQCARRWPIEEIRRMVMEKQEYVKAEESTLGRSKHLRVRKDGKSICSVHGETVQKGEGGLYYCPECPKESEN